MKTPDLPEGKPSAPSKRHFNLTGELFPDTLPSVIPARWPNRGTRADDALQALLQGPQNQADYWPSWRLGASIKSLQYLGWAFIKRDIVKPGCRGPITEYALDRTDPSTAVALGTHGYEVPQ
ncbi:MAG: hypothetical protein IPP59_03940 [Betaproteobacteria bacterium]|jgi:hypothetical protein|nr:hypothetical protein [Betaproteobacteria bacterium]MBK9783400.1 hypothetical protein [Candidatus Dechloromonas phosphorivorans]